MVVTGVTAMQPLMSPGHLAACREPWVMTKVCTPPAHLLSAVCFAARPSAGFYTQTHQTWPGSSVTESDAVATTSIFAAAAICPGRERPEIPRGGVTPTRALQRAGARRRPRARKRLV